MKKDNLIISKKKFNSRLNVGTGKYKSMAECAKAIKISGADIVTVAVRRVNITDKKKPLLMDYIDPKRITYLPNTAGCFNSDEALRTLRLAREIGGWKLVKLEVLGDKKNLFPEMIETLKSTEILTKEGFKVMVYCNDDPLMAKRLENVGAVAIMPLAAPIGSGLGILNKINIQIIRDQTKLPLIIDAGLGQASDAAIAMELGCDGVLINTAILIFLIVLKIIPIRFVHPFRTESFKKSTLVVSLSWLMFTPLTVIFREYSYLSDYYEYFLSAWLLISSYYVFLTLFLNSDKFAKIYKFTKKFCNTNKISSYKNDLSAEKI